MKFSFKFLLSQRKKTVLISDCYPRPKKLSQTKQNFPELDCLVTANQKCFQLFIKTIQLFLIGYFEQSDYHYVIDFFTWWDFFHHPVLVWGPLKSELKLDKKTVFNSENFDILGLQNFATFWCILVHVTQFCYM